MKQALFNVVFALAAVFFIGAMYFTLSPYKVTRPCSCYEYRWRPGSIIVESLRARPNVGPVINCNELLGVGCALDDKIFPLDLFGAALVVFFTGILLKKK